MDQVDLPFEKPDMMLFVLGVCGTELFTGKGLSEAGNWLRGSSQMNVNVSAMSLYVIAKFEALLCEEPPLDKAKQKDRSISELGKSKPVKGDGDDIPTGFPRCVTHRARLVAKLEIE